MIAIIGEATDAGRPTTLDDFARAGIPRDRAEALIGEAAGAYLARQTAREKARRIA
ncbi:hypothetical protein [Methylobrevis pamukkalensis]|uniref:Uncharacterized protein n=1 Tax=Methylobrevis pamukkalensis TaxID=1439726 RepID=A0A1E3H784_9HYPH|nr:hypothetical protein [Methylobrevis pamukkalensis]ODN72199.1 hypothetical protein A6302_00497 [Methylobrevis pamukkalensis]